MAGKNKRLPWLDDIKMFTMICVIMGHVGGLFANGVPGRLAELFVAFNMPLFVMLSGYSALRGLLNIATYTDLLKYLDKIFWRICVPTVCFSAFDQLFKGLLFARRLWFVFACAVFLFWVYDKYSNRVKLLRSYYSNHIIRTVMLSFLFAISCKLSFFWFLTMLIELQCLAAVLVWAMKSVGTSNRLSLPIVGLCVWILPYFIFSDWTFEMSSYFVLGLWGNYYGMFNRICHFSNLKCMISFITGCLLCRYITNKYSFYDYGLHNLIHSFGHLWLYPIRIVVALLISAPLIYWFYRYRMKYTWFSKMGRYTMAFYMIHALILELLLKPYFYMNNPHNYMWFAGFGVAGLLTFVSYLLILVLQRFKITNSLLLGK